jgi:hypothetical protein
VTHASPHRNGWHTSNLCRNQGATAAIGLLFSSLLEGKHVGSQTLQADDDPARVARGLLRETAGSDFNRPITYPRQSFA